MSILFDKVQLNILKVNKILDIQVKKKFYEVSEWVSPIKGEIEINLMYKGLPTKGVNIGINNFYKEEGGWLNFIYTSSEEELFNRSIRENLDGRDGCYINKKIEINKNDKISILNTHDKDLKEIINPGIKLNNSIVDFQVSPYVGISYYDSSRNLGSIKYFNEPSDPNREVKLEIGETYTYEYYLRMNNANGKKPGEGGRLGWFKFKYLGKVPTAWAMKLYSIDVLEKERDGVPFPHGEVVISYKLDIDTIQFEDDKIKLLKNPDFFKSDIDEFKIEFIPSKLNNKA